MSNVKNLMTHHKYKILHTWMRFLLPMFCNEISLKIFQKRKIKIQIQIQIQIKSWRVTRSARRAARGRRHSPTLLTLPITPPIIFLNHNICISKFWQYVKHRFYPAPKHTLLAEYSFRREILTWRINICVLQARIWNPIPHYWIYQYIHK